MRFIFCAFCASVACNAALLMDWLRRAEPDSCFCTLRQKR